MRKKKQHYHCKFCGKGFSLEANYLKHCCKEMMRDAEVKAPEGQAGLAFYREWFRQLKRVPPDADGFVKSRYYRSFIKFAEYIQRTGITNPEKYIRVMVSNDITPTIWTAPEAYSLYLTYIGNTLEPKEQLLMSVETILKFCQNRDIDTSQFFNEVTNMEFVAFLKNREIFPWILFKNQSFHNFFKNTLTRHDRVLVEEIINPSKWRMKIQKNPEIMALAEKFGKEMQL